MNIKKKEPKKAEIRAKAKDFGGAYSDKDLINIPPAGFFLWAVIFANKKYEKIGVFK